jgi:hypothetical protein
MGAARLLAKGWVLFCLYAGALALAHALAASMPVAEALRETGICAALFGAMGLLFISGFGLSSGPGGPLVLSRLKPLHLAPGFNELVFVAFVLVVLSAQIAFASGHEPGLFAGALKGAVGFAVIGQRSLATSLEMCSLGGGRLFVSACSWTLAVIFLGTALSNIRLAAGIVRLERKNRPEALGGQALAFLLGVLAVFGIQMLFIGNLYAILPCGILSGIAGDVLMGIGPMALAYLIVAAITNLLALGSDA